MHASVPRELPATPTLSASQRSRVPLPQRSSTALSQHRRQASARAQPRPMRGRNGWKRRPCLLAILPELVNELPHQHLIGGLIHADLPRRQVNRQRGRVALQLASGIARDGRDLGFGSLDNLALVLFRSLTNPHFFRSGLTLGRSANLGYVGVQLRQPLLDRLQTTRRICAGSLCLVNSLLNGRRALTEHLRDLH